MALLLPTLLTIGPFSPVMAPTMRPPPEIEIRTIVVVVADDGQLDAQYEPRTATATSPLSGDAALSDAFATARADCDGAIRQMGFDTTAGAGAHEAQLWYRCASPDIEAALAQR